MEILWKKALLCYVLRSNKIGLSIEILKILDLGERARGVEDFRSRLLAPFELGKDFSKLSTLLFQLLNCAF